ncbi:MAG: glutamine--fructose-6-phosphate transaminase (isomerizing) [Nocardioidaceae bacterium]
MCGIVGYVGRQNAAPLLVEGLAQLEYRGYDSAGIAVLASSGMRVVKREGRVRELAAAVPRRFAGRIGIGHTRWATHGAPSDVNAHPHLDASGRVAVVHNGIIDNAAALRRTLSDDGVHLVSDTDTELVAHLVGRSQRDTLEAAVLEALSVIEGTYGLAVLHSDYPDRIVLARSGSPLIIGVGEHETHVASDVAALVRYTTQVVHLDDGELATVTASGFSTFTADAHSTDRQPTTLTTSTELYELGDHEHFMHKEMMEQPAAVERAIQGRVDDRFATAHLGGLNLDARETRGIARVKIVGCGSAYYAGQAGAAVIEELARIPADAEAASEFRYRNPVIEPDTLYVATTQSGETADTLLAVQEIRRKGGRVVGIVNGVGSTIARECDGGIYLHAGPEVAVASTKALTNMAVAFALLATHLGRVRDLSVADGRRLLDGLKALPDQIATILRDEEPLVDVAGRLAKAPSLFFVGRVRGFPVAREGAQKFKEISYRHAEAYQTSELKHGPLALISPEVPTVAVVPQDELTSRNVGALHEIAARGGPLTVITHAGVDLDELVVDRIDVPKSEPELDPILLTIPLQMLAYSAARSLGHDIDKPRNLAKSVTVE